MQRVLVLLAAAGLALAAATPVTAHSNHDWNRHGFNDRVAQRIYVTRATELQARINRLDAKGRLSERDARRLRGQAAGLAGQIGAAGRNGLSSYERIAFEMRFAQLDNEIDRAARRAVQALDPAGSDDDNN
ncbi:MAG TPA: hypothetical protein VNB78_09260 [Sphingomicrobium sp.]|nr:hypothetical protein [Sphingomicrobium sp.]